jgi:hypothetical protein
MLLADAGLWRLLSGQKLTSITCSLPVIALLTGQQ